MWLEQVARNELSLNDDDEESELTRDLYLHHPIRYMQRTWYAWHKKSLMPRAGGVDNQLEGWFDDVESINGRYNAIVERLIYENKQDRSERRGTEDYYPPVRRDAPDLLDMIK